jgi:hypothetical protein
MVLFCPPDAGSIVRPSWVSSGIVYKRNKFNAQHQILLNAMPAKLSTPITIAYARKRIQSWE